MAESLLVRRGEVLVMGVPRRTLDAARRTGRLKPVRLPGRTREMYRRRDVMRVFGME